MNKFFLFLAFLFVAIAAVGVLSGEGIDFSDKVAVIMLEGQISMGSSAGTPFSDGSTGAREINALLESALADSSIKGVLLEINSPGGSPVAGFEVMRKVQEVARKKPVVVWVADLGASAAYLIASGANEIVMDENSVTGSIGTIGTFTELVGLFEKLGVREQVVKSGEFKDMGAYYRNMTAEELEIVQNLVDHIQGNFRKAVSENRALSDDALAQVSKGQLLSAKQALDLGLADHLGGRDAAVERLRVLLNLEEKPRLVELRKERSLLGELFGSLSGFGYSVGYGLGKAITRMEVNSWEIQNLAN